MQPRTPRLRHLCRLRGHGSRVTSTRVVKDDLSPLSQWLAPMISLVNYSGPLDYVSGNRHLRAPPRARGAGGDVDGPRGTRPRASGAEAGSTSGVRASWVWCARRRRPARRVDGKPFRLPRLSPGFPFFAFGQVLKLPPSEHSALGARTSGRIIIWTVIG